MRSHPTSTAAALFGVLHDSGFGEAYAAHGGPGVPAALASVAGGRRILQKIGDSFSKLVLDVRREER